MRKIFGDKLAGKIVILSLALAVIVGVNYFGASDTFSKSIRYWFSGSCPGRSQCGSGYDYCRHYDCTGTSCSSVSCNNADEDCPTKSNGHNCPADCLDCDVSVCKEAPSFKCTDSKVCS